MAVSPVHIAVQGTVPTKSMGRLLDALTDIIRPFTEKRGLKADLIRLQRTEVAYRVAELAARRIQTSKRKVTPVPLKALVPLLEKASLEDPRDKTMINLWANLLASAATGRQNNVPRYVSILSEINGKQARLIQSIMLKDRDPEQIEIRCELLQDHLWSIDQAGVILRLKQEVKRVSVDRIIDVVVEHVDTFGVALNDVIVNKGAQQWDTGGLFPLDKNRLDIEILESLKLLKDGSFKDAPFKGFELSVFFYNVTPLCIDMFAACNPHLFVS
jgi:hypothetical protein